MIYPESYYAAHKEAHTPIELGRIGFALVGRECELTPPLSETELLLVRTIMRCNKWHTEHRDEIKGKWRDYKKKERTIDGCSGVPMENLVPLENLELQSSTGNPSSTTLSIYLPNNLSTNTPTKKMKCGDSVSNADCDAMFEEWWKAYPGPRKVNKSKCREKFASVLKSSGDAVVAFNAIMSGLERWKNSDMWMRDGGKFVRMPQTWLNNRNWEDEPGGLIQDAPKDQPRNIHHNPNVEVEDAF